MLEDSSKFWFNRMKTIGHTGWKDCVIYAYDQLERMRLITRELGSICFETNNAMDFGCGSGDFCKLLVKEGYKVWGYDPYVKPKFSHDRFIHIPSYKQLDEVDIEFDLILSITVLDHIISLSQLEKNLVFLRSKISSQGVFLLIEYALDNHSASFSENNYQAFRTLSEWDTIFSECGWNIGSIKSVPHPYASPSIGFTYYEENVPHFWIKNLCRIKFVRPMLLRILKIYAKSILNKYGAGNVKYSPLKLMLCEPLN